MTSRGTITGATELCHTRLLPSEEDRAAGKAQHSDKLVAALRVRGLNIDYREQPNMGHCGPFDWTLQRRMTDFVLDQIGRKDHHANTKPT